VIQKILINDAILSDIALFNLYVNHHFGGTYNLHLQLKNQVSKKPACTGYLAIQTVDIRITGCYIPESGNIHNYHYENFKYCSINKVSLHA
jgi:hypothetical protein